MGKGMEAFLNGKVALITGGGRGIGAATALALARAGADIAVTARTTSEIQRTAETVRQLGRRAIAVAADVSQPEAVQHVVEEVLAQLQRIDVLINNAGVIQPVGRVWEVDPAAWQYNIAVNLVGVFLTTHAVLPHMLERGSGRIINVSTGAARSVVLGWSAYCAAKAGVDHFTRVVAAELAGSGVTINAMLPGVVDTEMQAQIRQTDPQRFPELSRFQMYKASGILRDPSEPAQMILWMCSPATEGMNGEILYIDDEDVRRRIARDLGTPMLPGRPR